MFLHRKAMNTKYIPEEAEVIVDLWVEALKYVTLKSHLPYDCWGSMHMLRQSSAQAVVLDSLEQSLGVRIFIIAVLEETLWHDQCGCFLGSVDIFGSITLFKLPNTFI